MHLTLSSALIKLLITTYDIKERSTTMKNRMIPVLAGLMLAVTSISFAATPAQVGTYSGTLKSKTFGAGGGNVVKTTMEVSVAADDTTTVTINGALQTLASGLGAYDSANVIVIFADPTAPLDTTDVNLLLGNFKGSTLKGQIVGTRIGNGPPQVYISSIEGKFKLKKSN